MEIRNASFISEMLWAPDHFSANSGLESNGVQTKVFGHPLSAPYSSKLCMSRWRPSMETGGPCSLVPPSKNNLCAVREPDFLPQCIKNFKVKKKKSHWRAGEMAGCLRALVALVDTGVCFPAPMVDSSPLPLTIAPGDLTKPSSDYGLAHSSHKDSRHTHTGISKNEFKMFLR